MLAAQRIVKVRMLHQHLPDAVFGADKLAVGVHQDGLVHISQLTNKKFVRHPMEIVSVGDVVEVKVMSVDLAKKRIQLTMILD